MLHKFPGFDGGTTCLHSFFTPLGTGAVKQRVAVLNALGEEYYTPMDNVGLLHDLGGCIDAPEWLPDGSTVRYQGKGLGMVETRPGAVQR